MDQERLVFRGCVEQFCLLASCQERGNGLEVQILIGTVLLETKYPWPRNGPFLLSSLTLPAAI